MADKFDPTQEDFRLLEDGQGSYMLLVGDVPFMIHMPPSTAKDIARARLASAAPPFARLWLKHEWAGEAERCLECSGYKPDGHWATRGDAHQVGHRTDCALDAAFRKAGAR